jgi:hypothetical protein
MSSDLRMDLTRRFQEGGLEFPLNPVYASLKEKVPAILTKMDDLALQRFQGYRREYDKAMTENISRTPDLVRQEFVQAWANVGKEMGKKTAPPVANTASFLTGTVGGILLTTALGPVPSALIGGAAALPKIMEEKDENVRALAIIAAIFFANVECSMNSGEALLLHSRKWEWPAAAGGAVGEWIGSTFGHVLTFVYTPRDKRAPDLNNWRIKICKDEIKALKLDQEDLKKVEDEVSEDQEIIKQASSALALRVKAFESILAKLEKKNQ